MSEQPNVKSDRESGHSVARSAPEAATWSLPDVLSSHPRVAQAPVGGGESEIATLSGEEATTLLTSLREASREGLASPAQEPDSTHGIAPTQGTASDQGAGRGTGSVRGVEARVKILGAVCERFLDPDDSLRVEALRQLPAQAGLSAEGAAHLLDRMAADWTRERLTELVSREFPEARPGDLFTAQGVEPGNWFRDSHAESGVHREAGIRHMIPTPSELVLTICSGTVPGVSVTAALRALLVGSGVLIKPGAGDIVLPVLFARALREADAELACRLAVVYWPGGEGGPLEAEALGRADRIVVYGGHDTLRSVRARTNPAARLIEYGHRVGIAVVGVEHGAERLTELADEVARAVVPYEQRGCVSPVRVIAVGPEERAVDFTREVAGALERWGQLVPSARTDEEEAAIHQLRTTLELRRAAGENVTLHSGAGWLVVHDDSPEPLAGGRIVRINQIEGVHELDAVFSSGRGDGDGSAPRFLQAVGVTGLTPSEEARVATCAARHGASRITPVGEMAWPPAWWIQDGQGPLRVLVDWTEWSRPA